MILSQMLVQLSVTLELSFTEGHLPNRYRSSILNQCAVSDTMIWSFLEPTSCVKRRSFKFKSTKLDIRIRMTLVSLVTTLHHLPKPSLSHSHSPCLVTSQTPRTVFHTDIISTQPSTPSIQDMDQRMVTPSSRSGEKALWTLIPTLDAHLALRQSSLHTLTLTTWSASVHSLMSFRSPFHSQSFLITSKIQRAMLTSGTTHGHLSLLWFPMLVQIREEQKSSWRVTTLIHSRKKPLITTTIHSSCLKGLARSQWKFSTPPGPESSLLLHIYWDSPSLRSLWTTNSTLMTTTSTTIIDHLISSTSIQEKVQSQEAPRS